ncbi:polysaccharide deacetylase family protein [Paenibacillus sp. R14(2021)]|uniref:polysaccharide deacetylase family protein n=1 Tax=Paenibacillus sp. R14(2021) TaxID=2859228 RepID=UPI001C61418D|nr:polysaccharide deacetylase family protein [Paenibacillus sp. R14(2021)]
MNRKLTVMSLVFVLAVILTGCYVTGMRWSSHSSKSSVVTGNGGTTRRTAAPGKQSQHGGYRNTPLGIYYRNQVIVLMYHEVAVKPMDDKALPLEKFKQQLLLMKQNNFHWITMEQYRQFILKDAKVPDNAVLMTFDDGYESYYTDTYPMLKQFHVPATNFLIVNTIGNPRHIGIPKLTWEQVQQMHREGYDFYNHTFDSHSYASHDGKGGKQLPELAAPMFMKDKNRRETTREYLARVTDDLSKADVVLSKKLGNKDHVLAFPYGAYNKAVLRICHMLGIDVTFTVKNGINGYGQRNGYRVNAGGLSDQPTVLIDLMKNGTRTKLPGSESSRFFLQLSVFSTAILGIVLMNLLLKAWEDKRGGRRLFRKR